MRRLACCLLLISLSPATAVESKPARVNLVSPRLTRRLPPVDKVELEKFKTREMWVESVEATRAVEGDEARRIARLWRTQNYRLPAAICHYPAYGIKFYSKGELILHASLCWQCDNIIFLSPKGKEKQGFDGRGVKGKELLEVFLKSF